MIFFRYSLLFFSLASMANAKVVEVAEDFSARQAPEDIVAASERAAKLFGFDQVYEVAVPKNSTIQAAPQTKFIAPGKNPLTHNPLLLINQSWFRSLPEDQQIFFLGRNFLRLMEGIVPRSVTLIHYLFIIISILFLVFSYFISGKTSLRKYNKGIRFVLALLLTGVCEYIIFDRIENKIITILQYQHDLHGIEKVVEITGNRNAAIEAIENLNEVIAREISAGETFWLPFVSSYKKFAQALRDNE